MVRIKVRAQPRAPRNEVVEYRGETLRIRVKNPPEKGKANTAILELLSEFLGVSRSHVKVLRGFTSRDKLIAVESLNEEELQERLVALLERAHEKRKA